MTFPESVRFQKNTTGLKIKYWQNYLTFTNEIHSKNLRFTEKLNLYIPKPNVELFRKTFAYVGADIWHSLPHDVKNAPSIKNT